MNSVLIKPCKRRQCPPARFASATISIAAGLVCLSAGCLLMLGCAAGAARRAGSVQPNARWTYDHGGIIRGDVGGKRLALIFTGGEHGEGTAHILDTLHAAGVPASFFVTGDYLAKDEYHPLLRRLIAAGHYLGPHSDAHPLYCAWEDRSNTLVDARFFRRDLRKNIAELRRFGALPDRRPIFFIPPYEWYNTDQVRWARELSVVLFNFTPGSGSNRDWIPEGQRGFVPSAEIRRDILDYERTQRAGLNGFLLLLHLGSQRADKMHLQLGPLLAELQARGYEFVRVDELLNQTTSHPAPASPTPAGAATTRPSHR
ncbi:MAG: polysaccharide deacetylase family protein [Planctomycetes bacterium]|nr:polysaccharide deacetylase family protein [Planctomycetota bacterium]